MPNALILPWYERKKDVPADPWCPKLNIRQYKNGFTFSFTSNRGPQTLWTPEKSATDTFAKLTRIFHYAKDNTDLVSRNLYIYLEYCYVNHKIPDMEGFDRVIELSTGKQ